MGMTVTTISGHENTQAQTIYFDTMADFNAFDVSTVEPSSIAYLLDSGTVYIKSSGINGTWVQQ